MTQLAQTIPSTNTKFGYPYNKRCEELIKLNEVPTKAHHRVWFKEQNMDLPIVRVPIELPKYRLANGRTSSLQAEYLAKNISVRDDIFSGDAELWDAQTAQHELLLLGACRTITLAT